MEWISVKDETPKDEQCVLAYGKLHEVGGFYETMLYADGYFFGEIHDRQDKTVTHWMPLPEPPE